MPARREIFAGFQELMWRPWGPLEPFDARLPRLLEAQGYATAIVTDHYHYWEESANGYIQSFQGAELIRGHELDFWKPWIPEDELPQWIQNVERWRPGFGRRYYSNVVGFTDETDFFPAKVMTGASLWLKNRPSTQPFFLQVESFDVHEPFDAPEPYASLYGSPVDRDQFTLWPPYQDAERLAAFMDVTSPEELAFIRSQYNAKVTMVDRWFGELTTTLEEEGLWDDTVVIVTTDHGHDLGQRNAFGKQFPHFDSHANIPLFIWHPDFVGDGGAVSGLTTTVDLFATILGIGGAEVPDRTHSRDLWPLIAGESGAERDAVVYGTFGQGVCCTDGEWTLIKAPAQDRPLYAYSSSIFQSLVIDSVELPTSSGHFIPDVALPQWQIPVDPRHAISNALSDTDYLFHRTVDPGQDHNLWDQDVEQRERMCNLLTSMLRDLGTPSEQFERLGL
jgi:arylsulfatase A-like enzyme